KSGRSSATACSISARACSRLRVLSPCEFIWISATFIDRPLVGLAAGYRARGAAQTSGLGRAGFRVQQAVQVDDEVAHMRIVHGLLRGAAPGLVRRLVIGIDADDVELGEIDELDPARL